jgi:hypothetical protein
VLRSTGKVSIEDFEIIKDKRFKLITGACQKNESAVR